MNELKVAKWGQCDNYCIFIASRHFETLQDHINLAMTTKRFRFTMERYYYNPIPITSKTAKFFPNIETQHIYSKDDEKIKKGRISRYCYWYPVEISSVHSSLQKENIEYKHLVYTEKYAKKIYSETKKKSNKKKDFKMEFVVPEGVKELGDFCFDSIPVKSLKLPSTLKIFGKNCLPDIDLEELHFSNVVPDIPSSTYSSTNCNPLSFMYLFIISL